MINSSNIPNENLFDDSILKEETHWKTAFVHDPAIYKDGDWYYVFSTDTTPGGIVKGGIQIRKSRDLINWQWVGRALDGVPEEAKNWTGAEILWAPEIVKYGDTYFMYYAASQFGKTQSFIGVAVSSKIEGPYEDRGEVYKSSQGEEGPNAIDPNVEFDKQGTPWMVYGSFFGGIYLARLSLETGKLAEPGRGKLIAKRHTSVKGAIEGPYIIYHPDFDYYYLFVSYDSLFSDYNIRIARSESIDGPYTDLWGNDMTDTTLPPDDVGLKVLGGYKFSKGDGWIAPGHNSVLKDGDDYYICHHARNEKDKKRPFLHIRKIAWTEDGWPLVSPERYAGEEETPVDTEDVQGSWELVVVEKGNNGMNPSCAVIISEESEASWKKQAGNSFTLLWNEKEIKGKILPGWDWELWQETFTFTGKNKEGTVVIGKKV